MYNCIKPLIANPVFEVVGEGVKYPIVRTNLCEYWIDVNMIPGFENTRDYYKVSNLGRIHSNCHGYLGRYHQENGYLFVRLCREDNDIPRNILVHRLVMMAFEHFVGCENYDVNHINGDKTDNRLVNLQWVTPLENNMHAVYTGLTMYNRQITEVEARKICELLTLGEYTMQQIADIVGCVSRQTVYAIYYRTCWNYISKDYIFQKRIGLSLPNSAIKKLILHARHANLGSKISRQDCIDALTKCYIFVEYCPRVESLTKNILANPDKYEKKLKDAISYPREIILAEDILCDDYPQEAEYYDLESSTTIESVAAPNMQ